jgi:hypothetical protein
MPTEVTSDFPASGRSRQKHTSTLALQSDMSLSKIAHLPQAKLSLVQQNGLLRTDVASGATALACGPWTGYESGDYPS